MEILNKEKLLEHAKNLTSEGKFDRAIEEYKKLLTLDPDDLRIKTKVAELYVKRKQIQEAIKLYMEIAGAYSTGGFYLKAVTVYKNMLRLNPSLIDINIALAELYEKMGLVQDALYQYQIVATSYEQKNNEPLALNIKEKMSHLDPENLSLKIRLAETYQLQGEVDKALEIYEGMVEKLNVAGKAAQLIEIYNKIISHKPERFDILKNLCGLHYKRGEWKEILKRMEAAKELVSKDPELLKMQADIFARLNQNESAKGKYKDIAVLLRDHGDIDGALKAYEDMLVLSPDDEEDLAQEIESIRVGSLAEISKRAKERREKAPDENTNSGEETSNPPAAGAKIEASAEKELVPGDAKMMKKEADVSYDLGQMYRSAGLKEEAVKELSKALEHYKNCAVLGVCEESEFKKIKELEAFFNKAEAKVKVKVKEEPEKEVEKEVKPGGNSKKISFV